MPPVIPDQILEALQRAHPSWHPILQKGLQDMAAADPGYLHALVSTSYLPTGGRLFVAFQLPLNAVRYVLVGEGPYPREDSATGVCFMDGAVRGLWSEKGLSRQVNRATSLRNFMKMLLVADGTLSVYATSGAALEEVAGKVAVRTSSYIQELPELQANLERKGFLLLNATLVFRPEVPPVKDAKAWRPFLSAVLEALAGDDQDSDGLPTLVLWGKIAEQLSALEVTSRFPKVSSEHPYNLSFIANAAMRELFGPMRLLQRV